MNTQYNPTTNFNLIELAERQTAGFSLEQPFYVSEEIYQHDLSHVLSKQWMYVDHVSSVPNPGDFITYEFGNDSIIITRNKDGELKAHFNVCRHRGSRICLKEQGSVKRLVCPYHAWTYNLDGDLLVAKQMPEGFNKDDYGLLACNIEVFEGLIFVNMESEDAPNFDEFRNNLSSFIKPHGIPNAKVAHTQSYTVDANWKLVVENFRECYHCTPSHPEYSSINAYVSAGDKQMGSYVPEVEAWIEKNINSPFEKGFKNFTYALQPHHAWRMPIKDNFKTATKDGQPAAPLMGDFKEYDHAETGVFFGPLTYFYFNNDHAAAFRVTPKSPQQTDVKVSWLVNANAQEEKDYDIDNLSWLWNITTIQDGDITVDNQKGVNSRFYQPGPYSEREYGTADFVSWYVARLLGKQEQRHLFRS